MRTQAPTYNLLTGNAELGSTSNGSTVGFSEFFEGERQPLEVTIINPSRLHIGLLIRRVPEDLGSDDPWVIYDNVLTNCQHECRTIFFNAGFQYAFRVYDTRAGIIRPEVFLSVLSDNAYRNYEFYHQRNDDDEWQCQVNPLSINTLPPEGPRNNPNNFLRNCQMLCRQGPVTTAAPTPAELAGLDPIDGFSIGLLYPDASTIQAQVYDESTDTWTVCGAVTSVSAADFMSLTNRVSNNEQSVASNTNTLSQLQNQVNSINNNGGFDPTQINQAIAALQQSDIATAADILALQNALANGGGGSPDLTALQQAQAANAAAIASLQATDTTVATDVTALMDAQSAIQAALAVVQASDATDDSDIDALEAANTATQAALAALQATDTAVGMDITDLETADASLQAQIDAISAAGNGLTPVQLAQFNTLVADAVKAVTVDPDPASPCNKFVEMRKVVGNALVDTVEQHRTPLGAEFRFLPSKELLASGTTSDVTLRVDTTDGTDFMVTWPNMDGTGAAGIPVASGDSDAYTIPAGSTGPIIISVGSCTDIECVIFGGAITEDEIDVPPPARLRF